MIHKKIGAFIFQDVQNPNETKTTAVTLRLYALILSVYFLVLFCVCCFLRDVPSSLLTLICGILYVFAFRITYLNHTHFASIFSQLLTLLWITVFIQRFGWDCGVQHFLFVLLVLNFAVSFHRIRTKIFVGICTCAYRLLLYSYTRYHLPVFQLSTDSSICIQTIDTLFIFAELITVMIIFTQNSQQMEHKLMRYNLELEHIASTDPLTGLFNRWQMYKRLETCISRYTQHKLQTLTVAMGDIDFFKHVNDTYGHDAGDEVLRTLSRLFCTVIGEKGEVCRWGGEEFLFVFPGMDMEEVQLLMSDLLDDIRHTPVLYERKLIPCNHDIRSRRIWQKSYHGICHSGSRPQALSRQREWAEPGDLLILCHLTHPVDFRSFSEEIQKSVTYDGIYRSHHIEYNSQRHCRTCTE